MQPSRGAIVTFMRVRSERAKVLITVKATPQPSETYGDTVCVAGIRLDTHTQQWIRLYPIAFRYLDGDAQFSKYDVIELDVRRRDADTRSESYSPEEGSWSKVGHVKGWKARHEIVGAMPATTTCQLSRDAAANPSAVSLGLVYPHELIGLDFEPHPPWTPDQVRKMQTRIAKEESALIPSGAVPTLLKAPRFKVKYRYRCGDASCNSHVGRILDWELTALQNRFANESDDRLQQIVREKFEMMMFNPKRLTGLFMGNFELAARRAKFSPLGVYYPERGDVQRAMSTLF